MFKENFIDVKMDPSKNYLEKVEKWRSRYQKQTFKDKPNYSFQHRVQKKQLPYTPAIHL